MPYTHGVVAQDDQLAIYLRLRELLPPSKFGRDLPGAGIVVALNEENVLTANSLAVIECVLAGSAAEISEEVEDIALAHGGVQPIENLGIHVCHALKRAIAVADDVLVVQV